MNMRGEDRLYALGAAICLENSGLVRMLVAAGASSCAEACCCTPTPSRSRSVEYPPNTSKQGSFICVTTA